MLWSILIAAITERFHSVQPLLYSLLELQSVARRPDIELLYLLDNKRRTVGSKRNALLDAALGEYISFIDDDDEVASNYVQKIVAAIAEGRKATPVVDVICFPQRATLAPSGVIHECSYSLAHWRDRKPEVRRVLAPSPQPNTLLWSGPPAHTMVWRRAILADDVRFPEQQFGEDVAWVDAACALAKTEAQIDGAPLYFYKFDEEKTTTR